MSKPVYITKTAIFLPNEPVPNEELESYLGVVNGTPSKSIDIVLRNNGIKTRYYALDKEGKATHTNAQMTALAVKGLFAEDPEKIKDLELLACGTSSPDQLLPSHGVMTHGWLPESDAIEVVSPSGVCCAGMHAFKYAYLAITSGNVELAAATGSERFSGTIVSNVFEEEAQKLTELKKNPVIAFEKDFLRWMLSDGAGAFLLSDKKNEEGLSLQVDWIEGVSYANTKDTCMYMGAEKLPDGTLKSYMDCSHQEIMSRSLFSIKQDIKLLSDNIIQLGGKKIVELFEKKGLTADDVDYFLPHISSEYFRPKIYEMMGQLGKTIPYEKWFINLYKLGNVGAGSAYLMVHELFNSGKLKKGERIWLLVP